MRRVELGDQAFKRLAQVRDDGSLAAVRSPLRFRVRYRPVKSPRTGNWAVVQRSTGRILSRHQTLYAAHSEARKRARVVQRRRAS